MKTIFKRILSLSLAFVICFLMFSIVPVIEIEAAETGLTLAQLRQKFPAGKYWNGGNSDSYTSSPCTHHYNCNYNGSCGCNSFKGLSIQCMGYAEKLGYDATGYNPRNNANGWYTNYSSSAIDSLKPGDIVRYLNNGHSIYVTAVNGNTVTYTDCNHGNTCIIRWDVTISKSELKSSFTYVRQAPFAMIEGVGLGSNFYAYIINTAAWKHLTNDGSNVSLRSEVKGNLNQIWYFELNNDGSYSIRCAADKKSLDVDDFGRENGTNVKVMPYSGNDAQKWYITGESAKYVFRVKCADTVLDVVGGSYDEGTNIQMWEYNGTDAQLFQVWPLSDFIMPVSVSSEQTVYDYGSSVTLNWDTALGVTTYWMHIWKDNSVEHYVNSSVGLNTSYTFSPEPGEYKVSVETCSSYPEWHTSFSKNYYFTVENKSYTIQYNANGGTNAPDSQKKYHDTELKLTTKHPIRLGYTFLGWATSSTATVATYKAGDNFNLNGDTTFYAVWKKGCADNNHSYLYSVKITPTKNSSGVLSGTCSKCSETTTVAIPELNTATYDYSINKPASCTSSGTGRYTWKTTMYGNFYFDVDIPATGHSTVSIAAKTPTCSEIGWNDYVYCSKCDYTTYKEIPKDNTAHKWDNGTITTTATCKVNGVKTYTCQHNAGHTYTEGLGLNADNHANTKNVPEVKATCTKTGFTAGVYCNDCEKYISGHKETAKNSNNHINTKKVAAVPSTPDSVGYTEGVYCNDCKKYISGHKEIPKTREAGDVNGDGKITAADARLALRASVGLEDLDTVQINSSDIDGNGTITAADARLILRASVGLEDLKLYKKD